MTERTRVGALGEIEAGTPLKTTVDGVAVVVVRIGDDVFALADRCSHEDASLSDGDVYEDDVEIECAEHGAMFDLRTGEALCLPATEAVAVYDAEVDADGSVWLRRREGSG